MLLTAARDEGYAGSHFVWGPMRRLNTTTKRSTWEDETRAVLMLVPWHSC